jgi:hypothetical protein
MDELIADYEFDVQLFPYPERCRGRPSHHAANAITQPLGQNFCLEIPFQTKAHKKWNQRKLITDQQWR